MCKFRQYDLPPKANLANLLLFRASVCRCKSGLPIPINSYQLFLLLSAFNLQQPALPNYERRALIASQDYTFLGIMPYASSYLVRFDLLTFDASKCGNNCELLYLSLC